MDVKQNLGRAIDFEGSRSEKDILNFVNRASGPAVKEPKKTLAALGETNFSSNFICELFPF